MARNNELAEWKYRLDVSHRKFKVIEPKIDRAWNYFRGKQWENEGSWTVSGYKDRPVDNMVFSNIRAIVPRLNFKNPKINVRPKKKPFRIKDGYFDTLAASASIECVLNYYYKVLCVKREARKCLYDALLSPWGIMELGYTLETEKIKDDELVEVNELISEDSPFAVRRDPKDFRSDPEGTDSHLNDARWIALRWVKSMDDIKRSDKYSNITNLKSNYRVPTEFNNLKSSQSTGVDESEESGIWNRVEGWTIWDKKQHRIMDLVEGHDKFIRNEKAWPLKLDGFPVEILYFNENSGDNYPIPDTWQYLDLQDELNRVSSMQMDHIRRISQRRYVARQGAFDQEEMRKLTHGGDGTVIETSMGVADSIQPMTDATISQDIYLLRQGLKNTIREMAGVSGMEAMVTQKFDQATEPALIEQASKTLRGDQQATFEDFIIRIVEKMANIIQQTADDIDIPLDAEQMKDTDLRKLITSKLAKIDGPEGAMVLLPWLNLEKNDIQGDYIYEIEIGSTMPSNEQQEKVDAVNLYNLFKDNPYVRGREGSKKVLESFKIPDPDKFLKTDEEVQQISMANAKAQIDSQIAVDMPKRQTDLAKTQIKSQTTKEVTAMKSQGDAQSKEMENQRHQMEMMQDHDKHKMSVAHELENQQMSSRKSMLDLLHKSKAADISLAEQREKATINLQSALKKKDNSNADV